jgi:hypothetical protein
MLNRMYMNILGIQRIRYKVLQAFICTVKAFKKALKGLGANKSITIMNLNPTLKLIQRYTVTYNNSWMANIHYTRLLQVFLHLMHFLIRSFSFFRLLNHLQVHWLFVIHNQAYLKQLLEVVCLLLEPGLLLVEQKEIHRATMPTIQHHLSRNITSATSYLGMFGFVISTEWFVRFNNNN